MRQIKGGTLNVSVVIRIIDSTDGTPETGVVAATAGLAFNYRREGAATVAITTINNLALLTTAHTDGGILHIGDGYYRVDFQDAAFAAGATGVLLTGTATGMVVIGEYVELVAYDPADAVRLGLTSLPNAAADAAGGLPISDAGGLDLDAKLANTNEVTVARMGALTDWIDAGRLDAILDAIKVKTDFLPSATAGAAGGVFIAGTNAATTVTTSFTTTFTGNLTGSVGSVTGAVGSVAGNVDGNVTGSVGSISGVTFPTNFADLSISVTTGLVDITQAAADKAWSTAARVLTANTNLNDPTAAAIADQVWEEAIADHSGTGGSTAEQLAAAGAAGDPWSTALPGAYGAGTAGYIVGTNIDATITSRMATYTQPTGFLAATFPTTVASTTNITAGTITTATNLTNLPAIPTNWLTAAGITNGALTAAKFAAGSLNGKGDWNTVTPVAAGVFTGITSMAEWLGAMAGKQTADANAIIEIRATGGGSGTYDATVNSLEAIRDVGDVSWVSATNVDLNFSGVSGGAGADQIVDLIFAEAKGAHTGFLTTLALEATVATAQADLDIITGADGVNLLTATQASIDAIETDTTTDIPALIAALNNLAAADVLTQVNAALDTAIAELGVGAPTATPTLRTGLMLLYMALRNKTVVQTSGTDALEIYNDAGTKIASKLLSDDGSDYIEAEMS